MRPETTTRGEAWDDYASYLRTEHWRAVATQARLAAGHKCQLCGATGVELHVHHNTYDRLGDELPHDLIVLCGECHDEFHARIGINRRSGADPRRLFRGDVVRIVEATLGPSIRGARV